MLGEESANVFLRGDFLVLLSFFSLSTWRTQIFVFLYDSEIFWKSSHS